MEYKVAKVYFDQWMSWAQVGEKADGTPIIGYGKLVRYSGHDAIVELTKEELLDAIDGCRVVIVAGFTYDAGDRALLRAAKRTLKMLGEE